MVRESSDVGVGTQPHVFVSYASQDAEQVLQVARLLEQEAVTLWRDGDRILCGQYYGEQIVHAIAHSRVVLLMCSPHAFQSDNVHREVVLTWDHYHRRYLPVWLSPAMDIPERFRFCLAGCQWIDAHSQPPERWLPQLLKSLQALGIETKDPAGRPAVSTPSRADAAGETCRRGLRFQPGDRPIRGADWRLERLLGKGGFGEVWKAHNPDLSGLPPVALKFCLDLDDRSRGLLRHEADMVLRAQQQIRSDGIVPLLHAYLNNNPPCLEYPYIEGGTLVRLLDECRQSAGSFTPAQVQRIIQRIAQIVSPAHRATPKLIHRDLKPSNVLAERKADGKVMLRVTDFGIGAVAAQPVLERSRSSSSLEGNLSAVLTGAYSPLYASPQQMRGDMPDPRDDVYALGVIWYQLLTSDLTSPAPTGRRWIDELQHRGMSDAAIDLLSSCVERAPAHRPDDSGMLAEQLQALSPSGSTKTVAPAIELPAIERRLSPSPVPSAPPPKTAPAPGPPAPAGRRALDVAGYELLDTHAPSPVPTAPVRRADPINIPVQPRARVPQTESPPPSSSLPKVHAKPAPTAGLDRGVDDSRTQPEPRRPLGPTGGSWRWVAAGALGLFSLLGVILYVVTDHGTVKITGTDLRGPAGGSFPKGRGVPPNSAENVRPVLLTQPIGDAKSRGFPSNSAESDRVAGELNPADHPQLKVEIKLKLIPAGTFVMGSPKGLGHQSENPPHEVRITRPFYLGAYEVTQSEYEAVMGQNPSRHRVQHPAVFQSPQRQKDDERALRLRVGGKHPVDYVTWLDAVRFCNRLSEREGIKPFYEIVGDDVRVPDWIGVGYRLPTEAEWEYACRAGSQARYCFGDDEKALREYAWFFPYDDDIHPVGEKKPNAFGLHDMHGNVSEWCWDLLDLDYYKGSPATDPRGPDRAAYYREENARVTRGGCMDANEARSANRNGMGNRGGYEHDGRNKGVGFRVARAPSSR
jgi:formylglycine-generating enzyme required for sulfatase activity/serine/threonine protein kinase